MYSFSLNPFRNIAKFEHADYIEDGSVKTNFTTSNPSETDSYCSTIIYNAKDCNVGSRLNSESFLENKKIENHIPHFLAGHSLSTSSASPDHGPSDSDNTNSDRDGNISRSKYSSSSTYR